MSESLAIIQGCTFLSGDNRCSLSFSHVICIFKVSRKMETIDALKNHSSRHVNFNVIIVFSLVYLN